MRTAPLLAVLSALLAATCSPARAGGPAVVPPGSPIVAVLDTGVRATHAEFGYIDRARPGNMVAWWDFTGDRKGRVVEPQAGQRWDPLVPEPYDPDGHGTGVTAMAVGRNRDPAKTPSAAPGFRFAVARVMAQTSGQQAPLGDAIRWAVHTVHASVLNISIGSIVPVPAAVGSDVYAALDDARASGVLVVVANGNGWGNVGVLPGEPAWAMEYSSSTSVLAVGAAGAAGLLVTTDPEVTTNYSPVTGTNAGDHSYGTEGGTSFASPFVAGFAARLIAAARQAHRPAGPNRIQTLIEYVARDTALPPAFEGFGEVELAQLPAALAYARSGGLPPRPTPDLSKDYVDHIAMLRDLWSNRLRNP